MTAGAAKDTLAPTLVGSGHLIFADRSGEPPAAASVHTMVTTVLGGVLR